MPTTSPYVVLRGEGRLLVGHVAVGNGVAGLVQRRTDDPGCLFTAAALGVGEPVCGANAGGLVCAALDAPGHALVPILLGGAGEVGDAVAMLRARQAVLSRAVTLLLADPSAVAIVSAGPEGVEVEVLDPAPGAATLADLLAAVRAAEPQPEVGAAPALALAAVLDPQAEVALHFALGPPSCSVFVRCFPGYELVAGVSAGPEGAPLARLAAAVAQTTSTDPDLRAAARARLDAAEAETLSEGEAAARMAALMDEHTDDRGAAVRRVVAQSWAAEVASVALHELAVPARSGPDDGPRL